MFVITCCRVALQHVQKLKHVQNHVQKLHHRHNSLVASRDAGSWKKRRRTELRQNRLLQEKTKDHTERMCIYAIGTGIPCDLQHLTKNLSRHEFFHNYNVRRLPPAAGDSCVHLSSNQSDVFIFGNGCAVTWSIPQSHIQQINLILSLYQMEVGQSERREERERLTYDLASETSLVGEQSKILISDGLTRESRDLVMFTVSKELSNSVILAFCESELEQFIKGLDFLPQRLKEGKTGDIDMEFLLKSLGKLHELRYLINLKLELLDVPDVCWDNDFLDPLYNQMKEYLELEVRVKYCNDKLTYCNDLIHLLKDRDDVIRGHRLEKIIIILISLEIVIELLKMLFEYFS